MTDNITLRRAVAEQMRDELYSLVREADSDCDYLNCKECEPIRPIWDAIVVFDAALAEPEPEPDAIAQAVEAEREACAKIVYGLCVSDNNAQEIVNAIRARGSK